MRVACLYVEDLALVALLRADVTEELAGRAVVVTDGEGGRALVLGASAAAQHAGVRAGQTVAQAGARCPVVVTRVMSAQAMRATLEALGEIGESVSPRVELVAPEDVRAPGAVGMAFVDVGGLGQLYASERQLGTELWARATKLGLEPRVAIAGSKSTAAILCRAHVGVTVAPADAAAERALLAPLPVSALSPSPRVAETLERWGVRSVGALAALPAERVALRLGEEAVRLGARARAEPAGRHEAPLAPTPRPLLLEERAEWEYAIESLEPLSFVLRGVLDRVVARAALRGMACASFVLELELEPRGREQRTVVVAAPTREASSLLMLARATLESQPPAAGVRALTVRAEARAVRGQQLQFFAPPRPAPERLATTLARLQAMVGSGRVGAPALARTHRVGAFEVAEFRADVEVSQAGGGRRLALHALRPARVAEVFFERGVMTYLRAEGVAGRVVGYGGPWRVTADWWTGQPYGRDYYDIELEGGGLYRAFREHAQGSWHVDARYD